MTVPTTENRETFDGNGVTTTFPFSFPFFTKDNIKVFLLTVAGVESELVLDVDYTIPGVTWRNGGQVDMVVAPATGDTLVIARVLESTQTISFRNQGNFKAASHEDGFDKMTMLIQQVLNGFRDALKKSLFSDDYDAMGNKIINLKQGTDATDSVNLIQVQDEISAAINGGREGPVYNTVSDMINNITTSGGSADLGVLADVNAIAETATHNIKSNAGGKEYKIVNLAAYEGSPDGEQKPNGDWIGGDYLDATGQYVFVLQLSGSSVNPQAFGYIGIGVIDNGPTIPATPDPTADESQALEKIGEYTKRGAALDIGASSGGVAEFLQKGAYNIDFPSRGICNVSDTIFDFPLYINLNFNGTEIRPLSPINVFNRRSARASVNQTEINYTIFNTPQQMYEAAQIATQPIRGVGYLEIPDGEPDPGLIQDLFSTYSRVDVRGGWVGFHLSEYGILFGDIFEKCNDYDSLSWGFDFEASANRIATTCVFDRPWCRKLERDAVQYGGFVYRALQHMATGNPIEPGVTAGWEDYWQLGLIAFTEDPEVPTDQPVWASGTFYRGHGLGYRLVNMSTLIMNNGAMDGGNDVIPGSVITTNMPMSSYDSFHLERHQKVKTDSPSILVAGGGITMDTLYLAEVIVQTGRKDFVVSGGIAYGCKITHTSGASTEPGVGVDWPDVWDKRADLDPSGRPAWVTATDYQTGNALMIGSTVGRRGYLGVVEEKSTIVNNGQLMYVDASNFANQSFLFGHGVPRGNYMGASTQYSVRDTTKPLTQLIPQINPTSAFTIRPQMDDNGQIHTVSLTDAPANIMTVEIDGEYPQGTKFGFFVSETSGGTSNQAGTIQLTGINGAFFVGDSSISGAGAIWVEKTGLATNGDPNSWRTWIEGGGASGEWIEALATGFYTSNDALVTIPNGKTVADIKAVKVTGSSFGVKSTIELVLDESYQDSPELTIGNGTNTENFGVLVDRATPAATTIKGRRVGATSNYNSIYVKF